MIKYSSALVGAGIGAVLFGGLKAVRTPDSDKNKFGKVLRSGVRGALTGSMVGAMFRRPNRKYYYHDTGNKYEDFSRGGFNDGRKSSGGSSHGGSSYDGRKSSGGSSYGGSSYGGRKSSGGSSYGGSSYGGSFGHRASPHYHNFKDVTTKINATKKFREEALKTHPDKFSGPIAKKNAEQRMSSLNAFWSEFKKSTDFDKLAMLVKYKTNLFRIRR